MASDLQRLLAHRVKPVESAEQTLKRINPSTADVFLSKVSRGKDIKGLSQFFGDFRDWKKAKEFLTTVLMSIPSEGQIIFDLEKVRNLATIDPRWIDEEYKKMHDQNLLVTPFSLGSLLTECSVLTCEGESDGMLNLKGALGNVFRLPFTDEEKWYKTGTEILNSIKSLEKRKIYSFYPFSREAKILTYAVAARYECSIEGTMANLIIRSGVIPPPGIMESDWDLAGGVIGDLVTAAVAFLQDSLSDTLYEENQLALIYSLIIKNDVLGSIQKNKPEVWADFSSVAQWAAANPQKVVVGTDSYEAAAAANNYMNTGADVMFDAAKSFLDNVRIWRQTISTLNKRTHDLCLEYFLQHIPDNRWGPVHRAGILCHMHDSLGEADRRDIGRISLVGAGSDYVARAIEHCDEFLVKGEPLQKDIYQTAVSHVTGNINHHTQKSIKDDEASLFPSTRTNFVLVTDYSEFVGPHKDEVGALAEFLHKIPSTFKGVAAFAMTMCHITKLFGIVSVARTKKFRISVQRHPRRHNDAFFFIISSNVHLKSEMEDSEITRFHFGLCKEVMVNNKTRNIAMWTGFEPLRLSNPSRPIVHAFGAVMKLKDVFKSIGKKGAVSKEGQEYMAKNRSSIISQQRIQSDEEVRLAVDVARSVGAILPPGVVTDSTSMEQRIMPPPQDPMLTEVVKPKEPQTQRSPRAERNKKSRTDRGDKSENP